MKLFLVFLILFFEVRDGLAIATSAPSATDSPVARESRSMLTLPRFVSLRAKTVNLHVGPGNTYPTEWIFVRAGLPVEIIAEFDTWRQIRDWQGTQGWVHKSLLCGKRTAVVQQKQRKLYKEPEEASRVVAHLDPGVLGKLMECRNDWCKLEVEGVRGWIKRRCIWGVYPHEDKFK